jgi:hypothetical protein
MPSLTAYSRGESYTDVAWNEFSSEWEEEHMQELAVELLPYYLLAVVDEAIDDNTSFERHVQSIYSFYLHNILKKYYYGFDEESGLHEDYVDAAIDDFIDDDDYFQASLEEAIMLARYLPPGVIDEINTFVASLN